MKYRVIALVILVAAGLFFYQDVTSSMPDGYRGMSAAQAHAELALNPEAHILDIRTPAEFVDGHLEHAVNIDFYARSFEADLGKLDKSALYFIYCRSGNRSSQALNILEKLGFTRVWHLADGIIDWERDGLPLVR